MPKPYSYDLRQKVIQAIKLDGLKIYEASILFSIATALAVAISSEWSYPEHP